MSTYQSSLFPGLVVPVKRSDLSANRTVPGGLVASYADITAAEEAREFAGQFNPAMGAQLDWVTRVLQVDFVAPLEVGDTLRTSAQVVAIGKRSLTLEVLVFSDRSTQAAQAIQIAKARAVMVSVQNHQALEHHLSVSGLVAANQVSSFIQAASQRQLIGISEQLTHSNLMFPKVLNPHQSVFGGYIAEMVDQSAAVHAKRLIQSQGRSAAFASANASFVSRAMEVNYLAPIEMGDLVQIWTTPIRASNSTVSFGFRIESRRGKRRSAVAVGAGEVVLVAWQPASGQKFTHQLF